MKDMKQSEESYDESEQKQKWEKELEGIEFLHQKVRKEMDQVRDSLSFEIKSLKQSIETSSSETNVYLQEVCIKIDKF